MCIWVIVPIYSGSWVGNRASVRDQIKLKVQQSSISVNYQASNDDSIIAFSYTRKTAHPLFFKTMPKQQYPACLIRGVKSWHSWRLELPSSRTKLNQTCSATVGGSFTVQEHRWDQLASKYVSVAREKHRKQQWIKMKKKMLTEEGKKNAKKGTKRRGYGRKDQKAGRVVWAAGSPLMRILPSYIDNAIIWHLTSQLWLHDWAFKYFIAIFTIHSYTQKLFPWKGKALCSFCSALNATRSSAHVMNACGS